MGSSKKEKRRSEKKSKNASTKPIPTKKEDVRGKSPSRHGKLILVVVGKTKVIFLKLLSSPKYKNK